jgi:hypothetical protein
MNPNPDSVKENRIWWLVLALMATATALLVLGYIDKGQWQIIVLTLFATFVTGVALNGVAQGANNLLVSKGMATTTVADSTAELNKAQAEVHSAQANETNMRVLQMKQAANVS